MPDPKTTFWDLSGRFSGGFLSGICFKHSGKARIFIQNTPQVWNHEHVGDSWSHLHTVLTVFYLIFTLEISQNSADFLSVLLQHLGISGFSTQVPCGMTSGVRIAKFKNFVLYSYYSKQWFPQRLSL